MNSCCYAWWCPLCAAAQARTNLNASNCCFNICCMSPIPIKWLIRTSYGIVGTAEEDWFSIGFCHCCAINQMLQTTQIRGNPFNRQSEVDYGCCNCDMESWNTAWHDVEHMVRTGRFDGCDCNDAYDCLYSFVFFTHCPYFVGKEIEEAIGMPFWMTCFFVNPVGACNILRMHYRTGTHDCYCCCNGGCNKVKLLRMIDRQGRLKDKPGKNPSYMTPRQ